jgi:nucleotide-binding universal stress UspA family protein
MNAIVVGLDGSTGSEHAVMWAATEARLHHLPLRAVLAWDYLNQHHADGDNVFDPAYGEQDAREALTAYLARAFAPGTPPEVEQVVVCDLPARALLDAAAGAELLVVGARGRGGFASLVLGSTSHACVRHAPCPVAVVRPGASLRTATSRIVVGVDGSASAQRALRWAVREASARDAALDVVFAWHLPYTDGFPYALLDPGTFADGARTTIDEAVAAVDVTGMRHPIRKVTCNDSPASALLDASSDADLVVVGSRGRGGFAGLLLGSVSSHLAHHATCPVVVVPSPPHEHRPHER